MASLRIHPAIGVARIGNSDQFFIGPELPGVPGNWDGATKQFLSFKDAQGRVLRQAARFRIFRIDESGNAVKEVTLADGVRIEWRVHVANRKASFFTFNGQSGAESNPPYAQRARRPADAIEKPEGGRGAPERKNRRNAGVADRRSLEIDPGPVRLSAPGRVDLIDNQTPAPIKQLGEAHMEDSGRLLFLGGSGATAFTGPNRPPLDEYASNDGWFDDMSDGSIEAAVTFADGHVESAVPAWVIVGPPKFAPGIRNVVPLYDTLWDLAVRSRLSCDAGSDPILNDLLAQQRAWQDATQEFAPTYMPSFLNHVYPILSRALASRDVHEPPPSHQDYHGTLVDWPRLATRAATQIRRDIFRWIRDPNSKTLDWKGMPRGLGDEYTSLDNWESEPGSPPPTPRSLLSLTPVQYALLKAWVEGRFTEDWPFGDVRYAPIPDVTGAITPHGLDRAALENCVGGPFYPGIEVSWLVRLPELYAAAFRLRNADFDFGPLHLGAGFFSQQMALPWHADFYDCHKEPHQPPGADETINYMWWTAQRPDDIRSDANGPYRRWVQSFDASKDADIADPDDVQNLARFEQMRTRWSELSFVVLEGDDFIEQK